MKIKLITRKTNFESWSTITRKLSMTAKFINYCSPYKDGNTSYNLMINCCKNNDYE